MSELKVGDRVKFVGDRKRKDHFYEETFNPKSTKGTIRDVDYDGDIQVVFDSDVGGWGEDGRTQSCNRGDLELLNESTPLEQSHYKQYSIEAIDVIESWKLGFNLGNTVKYIARAEFKGSKIKDLEKARFYLDREIENLKKD